ncbi:unnamed protein product [Chrysoparadoxa australica]
MYIAQNVPEDYNFVPKVRKEISEVAWFPIDNLPKGTYGVEPFINRLKRWIKRKRKRRSISPVKEPAKDATKPSKPPKGKDRDTSSNRSSGGAPAGGAAPAPKAQDRHNADTFGGGLALEDGQGWGFEEMMAANEKLTGQRYIYDGSPHRFGDKQSKSKARQEIAGAFPVQDPAVILGPEAAPSPTALVPPLTEASLASPLPKTSAPATATSTARARCSSLPSLLLLDTTDFYFDSAPILRNLRKLLSIAE